jgi:ERCC4-type nuclease
MNTSDRANMVGSQSTNTDVGNTIRQSNRIKCFPTVAIGDRDIFITRNPIACSTIDEWEVVLLIDHREKDCALIQSAFHDSGQCCERCQLTLGDFAWIARRKSPDGISIDLNLDYVSDASNCTNNSTNVSKRTKRQENAESLSNVYMLDCLIERKTANDLADSIKDGRYEEQKNRLYACGIAHVIYLVEGSSLTVRQGGGPGGAGNGHQGRGKYPYPGNTHAYVINQISSSTLRSAVASTQVSYYILYTQHYFLLVIIR